MLIKKASTVFGILVGYALGYALDMTTGICVIAYASSVALALVVPALGLRVPKSC